MRHNIIFTIAAAALLTLGQAAGAQTPKDVEYTFTEGYDLTLAGKLFTDTPNPYHRVDTVKYKGFTVSENKQVRESSGLMIMFNTNSTTISVKTDYGYIYNGVWKRSSYEREPCFHPVVREVLFWRELPELPDGVTLKY